MKIFMAIKKPGFSDAEKPGKIKRSEGLAPLLLCIKPPLASRRF
jgi:hypothetical protein